MRERKKRYNSRMTMRTTIPDGEWSGRIPFFARRIGEAAGARRVVLFGSAARGDPKKHSDLDFLVVVPEGDGRLQREACLRARRAIRGLKRPPMDIVVVGEEDARRHRENPFAVVKPAMDEGVEVWRSDDF